MQQTQTYKLNLIETSDTFSPAPLNENAQKVEAQFSAEAAARAAETAALDQRVTVLEAKKIVAGTYTGDGVITGQTINLGFTPRVVYVQANGGLSWLSVTGFGYGSVQVKGGGFLTSGEFNSTNVPYPYFAIL